MPALPAGDSLLSCRRCHPVRTAFFRPVHSNLPMCGSGVHASERSWLPVLFYHWGQNIRKISKKKTRSVELASTQRNGDQSVSGQLKGKEVFLVFQWLSLLSPHKCRQCNFNMEGRVCSRPGAGRRTQPRGSRAVLPAAAIGRSAC